MAKRLYALVGAGGHGREVMPLMRASLAVQIATGEVEIAFVEEDRSGGEAVNGVMVMTMDQLVSWPGDRFFNVAIGASDTRMRIAEYCLAHGMMPHSIIADSAIIMDNCEIGEGVMLCPFSMVTSNVKIGRFFHANHYAYVTHDCIIGDYVTFAPRASCNGRVHIGEHAYIGAGALIKHGAPGRPLTIGHHAVIGMGAVVTRSVPANITVLGNPARPMNQDVRS